MTKHQWVAVFLSVALAGCASPQAISRMTSYPSTVTPVKMADDTYRVFEKPEERSIMTTPSIAAAAAMGAARGATLGLANVMTPEQRHEAAAQQYLAQTGRPNCKITKGYLLAEPQYEFHYECPTS
ncbi:hypothetical protein CDO28_01570 [Sinorhizobium meliloti]|uniref:hypothetical protein n=1 Tax=Rhizobium meliloti TaxID=382 RepID=UPI000B49A0DF|nr:hypothetical protein [Sinorhizobium meliloti]ASP70375.1 hypothetical protein CDO28_01570 [Sinorhizobium meliloti]MDE3854810.1 hypothetical protein [Sinorhizobium meliloti]MQW52487.1 hypothetical protein [Sinorhizobium meliloti]